MKLLVFFLILLSIFWLKKGDDNSGSTIHIVSVSMRMRTEVTHTSDTTEGLEVPRANPAVSSNTREEAHIVATIGCKVVVNRGDTVSKLITNIFQVILHVRICELEFGDILGPGKLAEAVIAPAAAK